MCFSDGFCTVYNVGSGSVPAFLFWRQVFECMSRPSPSSLEDLKFYWRLLCPLQPLLLPLRSIFFSFLCSLRSDWQSSFSDKLCCNLQDWLRAPRAFPPWLLNEVQAMLRASLWSGHHCSMSSSTRAPRGCDWGRFCAGGSLLCPVMSQIMVICSCLVRCGQSSPIGGLFFSPLLFVDVFDHALCFTVGDTVCVVVVMSDSTISVLLILSGQRIPRIFLKQLFVKYWSFFFFCFTFVLLFTSI
jgi:hypothetical protein